MPFERDSLCELLITKIAFEQTAEFEFWITPINSWRSCFGGCKLDWSFVEMHNRNTQIWMVWRLHVPSDDILQGSERNGKGLEFNWIVSIEPKNTSKFYWNRDKMRFSADGKMGLNKLMRLLSILVLNVPWTTKDECFSLLSKCLMMTPSVYTRVDQCFFVSV